MAIESVVFKSSHSETILASNIAPWIPPCSRGYHVYNTEHLKGTSTIGACKQPDGCPKELAELIRQGSYDPLTLSTLSKDVVKRLAQTVGIPHAGAASATKVLLLCMHVQSH